ncbi:DUF3375 domain-containing protein [Cryobacterium sp. Hh7]|uniref:DUF3375 domain-containing protein n=1 Tax=Cryobacterium sp. Hh7 TaxID=1259159 RepID=UPI00106DD10A|nr:DUF3375 domain-containing protein [Cryobacterium sp. Hh7]TFD55055.1 DUF3375 domain-containing protein [Cryobacterium sp. Hh7]
MTRTVSALLARTEALRRARGESSWTLLAAHNAPEILAILKMNFIDSGATQIPTGRLHERVADDLRALARAGIRDMSASAQKYCTDWVSAGWLERRPNETGTEEIYDVSADAHAALLIAETIVTPASSTTESQMTSIMQQLSDLAVSTDPNPESRIAALTFQRDAIDAEIDQLRAGRTVVLNDERALEAVRDLLGQVRQSTTDFARVRRSVGNAVNDLRRQAIESDGSRGDVLEIVLSQVDQMETTDFGRSFKAFYQVLADPERVRQVESAIDVLLERPFSAALSRAEREGLRDMLPDLRSRAGDVHTVFDTLAAKLRAFVEDNQYAHERRVDMLIKDIYKVYGQLAQTMSGRARIPFELKLSTSDISSVSQLQLKEVDTSLPDLVAYEAEVGAGSWEDLLELVDLTDIDFHTLRANIKDTLRHRTVASIADVISKHPLAQGLASLIGLILIGLGAADGDVCSAQMREGADEVIPWSDTHTIRIPKILFYTPETQ